MNEIFGIPAETLLVVLAILVFLALGGVGVLSLRNPILLRLGVRNVRRRRGRSALIVVGLMLGTAIIAAALTTGDTMSHTIRATAVTALGETDEVASARGAADDIPGELGGATGTAYFAEDIVARVERAVAGSELVDGVNGAIIEQVALQAPRQGRTEPSVILFAADPARMRGFAPIRRVTGGDASLDTLGPAEAFLNDEAAEKLAAGAGDTVELYAGALHARLRVRDVVRFEGAGTADAALLLPLAEAQRLLRKQGSVKHVLVSNRGGDIAGAELTDDVVPLLAPAVEPLGLEIQTVKQDAIAEADELGTAFMAFFTTFGSFSIVAGIVLIFLIFVMLAAERRGELGIARAVGTRRGHLVQMFVFEGLAYDLLAAFVGAVLGALVALGMVFVMAGALGAEDEDAGVQIEFAVAPRSLLIAAALGILLTLVVVGASAWRVSMMTIAAAIRNLPEPPTQHHRTRILRSGLGLGAGLLLAAAGISSATATPLFLGISLVVISLVPLVRLLGVPERLAFTSAGVLLIVMWLLPWRTWEWVFGPLAMDFSTWIVTGLMIVVGAVWTIVHNADVLLDLVMRSAGRVRALAPVVRMSIAYPLSARFRTGTTLGMFTLVVFTLVTGAASSGSFNEAMRDVEMWGGGYEIRGGTSGTAPVDDLSEFARVPGVRSSGNQSVLAVDATQVGAGRPAETYVARGLDDAFLAHTTFGFDAIARGYRSRRAVWDALRRDPTLAVVDAFIVPRRDKFGFAAGLPDFRLSGFYADDGDGFAPVAVRIRDPQTGRETTRHVIGVLRENVPWEMVGLSTSQHGLEEAFPGRVKPTVHYFGVAPGFDPDATASRLERAFLVNGLQAESIRQVMEDQTAAGRTFNRLIMGFMGLGLVVGVAALGVISARAVVERRQQIGVMRSIGFRRRMVQAAFLLESSFVALTAIIVGTVLGLVLAWNIVDDTRRQPSWDNLSLVVPWGTLAVIFAAVYLVALLATLAPAARASRISPAEALRYE